METKLRELREGSTKLPSSEAFQTTHGVIGLGPLCANTTHRDWTHLSSKVQLLASGVGTDTTCKALYSLPNSIWASEGVEPWPRVVQPPIREGCANRAACSSQGKDVSADP
jgi:hypothetical protein